MKLFSQRRDVLDQPLLRISSRDQLTIRDIVQGGFIVGGSGSGKTSGSGKNLACALLKSGFGGLVLTAKSSEKDLWIKYCEETQRMDSLIVLSPDSVSHSWKFNFLDWESNRPGRGGGLALNIRQLLLDILDALQTSRGSEGTNEQFWKDQREKLLGNSIDLLQLAQQPITVENLVKILKSAPSSPAEIKDPSFVERSFCARLLATAKLNKDRMKDGARRFELLQEYWCWEFPKHATDKAKGSLVMIVTGMLQNLRQNPLSELFCGKTTFIPEYCREGAIILVDLPLDVYRDVGRMGQLIMKLAWQRAMQSAVGERPVFCWADEAQNFITKTDYVFTGQSREYRAATIYLSQNLPSLFSALGNGEEGKRQVFALLGNLQNKIFHANDDPETNRYACDVIGRDKVLIKNTNSTTTQGQTLSGSNNENTGEDGILRRAQAASQAETVNIATGGGVSETVDYQIQPAEFTRLSRRRQIGRDYYSEAIFFANGKPWVASGNTFLKCLFKQS